jgi:hypothetical protein
MRGDEINNWVKLKIITVRASDGERCAVRRYPTQHAAAECGTKVAMRGGQGAGLTRDTRHQAGTRVVATGS